MEYMSQQVQYSTFSYNNKVAFFYHSFNETVKLIPTIWQYLSVIYVKMKLKKKKEAAKHNEISFKQPYLHSENHFHK